MSAWVGQNLLPSPHPLHYVFGYGLLATLALPGIRWAWRRGQRAAPYLLLPAWIVAGPVLAYLPIGVQRRLLEGIFIPLCILATQWRDPANRLFHTEEEIAALDWLNAHAADDAIVLSEFDTGNYLPVRTSLRAFIGHGPETIRLDMKREQARRFFAGAMNADEQRSLFDTYRIRYIIFP